MLFCVSIDFMRFIRVWNGLTLIVSHLYLRFSLSAERPYSATSLQICDVIVEICERLSYFMLVFGLSF